MASGKTTLYHRYLKRKDFVGLDLFKYTHLHTNLKYARSEFSTKLQSIRYEGNIVIDNASDYLIQMLDPTGKNIDICFFINFAVKYNFDIEIIFNAQEKIKELEECEKWEPEKETVQTNPYTPLGGLSVPEQTTHQKTQMFYLKDIAISLRVLRVYETGHEKVVEQETDRLEYALSKWLEKK